MVVRGGFSEEVELKLKLSKMSYRGDKDVLHSLIDTELVGTMHVMTNSSFCRQPDGKLEWLGRG